MRNEHDRGTGVDTAADAAAVDPTRVGERAREGDDPPDRVERSEAEWRALLTPEQFHVTREKGTERAFTGRYHDHHEPGIYRCVACGNPLFSSVAKYDSGSGWPSFYAPIREGAVDAHADRSFGMTRTEIVCSRCGSHLGHVFPDGPAPTGLRYCMNSAALDFQAATTGEE